MAKALKKVARMAKSEGPTVSEVGSIVDDLLTCMTTKGFSCKTKKLKIDALPTECKKLLADAAPYGLFSGSEREQILLLHPKGSDPFVVATFDDDDADYHCRYVLKQKYDESWQLLYEVTGG